MKKILLAVVAAALGGAILSGGSAMADDDEFGYLATGFTFCPAGASAVFPATNVSKRPVWIRVSCVDAAGNEFSTLSAEPEEGPVKAKVRPGKAVILASACEDVLEELDGDLVRCTVWSRHSHLERVRGVLHICQGLDCGLTEALLFSSNDD